MTRNSNVIAYEQHVEQIYMALVAVEEKLAEAGIDPLIKHLVKLRASQINGCAFCVDMHTREARNDGETNTRLDRLIVWRHVSDFSAAEKAALAWAEALTVVKEETNYEALRAELFSHYSEQEISVLTSVIAMINLWNRLQVSKH